MSNYVKVGDIHAQPGHFSGIDTTAEHLWREYGEMRGADESERPAPEPEPAPEPGPDQGEQRSETATGELGEIKITATAVLKGCNDKTIIDKDDDPPLTRNNMVDAIARGAQFVNIYNNNCVFCSCLVRTWMAALLLYNNGDRTGRFVDSEFRIVVIPYLKDNTPGKGNKQSDLKISLSKFLNFLDYLRYEEPGGTGDPFHRTDSEEEKRARTVLHNFYIKNLPQTIIISICARSVSLDGDGDDDDTEGTAWLEYKLTKNDRGEKYNFFLRADEENPSQEERRPATCGLFARGMLEEGIDPFKNSFYESDGDLKNVIDFFVLNKEVERRGGLFSGNDIAVVTHHNSLRDFTSTSFQKDLITLNVFPEDGSEVHKTITGTEKERDIKRMFVEDNGGDLNMTSVCFDYHGPISLLRGTALRLETKKDRYLCGEYSFAGYSPLNATGNTKGRCMGPSTAGTRGGGRRKTKKKKVKNNE